MAKKKVSKKIDVKGVTPSSPALESAPESQEGGTMMEQGEKHVTHEQIAAKAKEIWMARGTPWGQDLEIWLEAEKVLRG
jgi:hypothetical protein